MQFGRLFPWVVRAVWAVLPVVAGPGLGDALDGRSGPVQTVASVGLWTGWAVGLLATSVPHPLGLTYLRVTAPVALAGAAWSGDVLAVVSTLVAGAVVFAPATGVLFVNGPAYPNERRFPLRAPGPLLIGLLPLAWVLAVGPVLAGALLVAARQWVVGGLSMVVGAGLAFVLLRAIHLLSRRWLVFVPAGVVVHDPMSLADPVLFQRQQIESLDLAPADTDSLDLTQRAPGLALELVLTEKVPMMLVRPGSRVGEQGASARLLVMPTRPGAVLEEARRRRLSPSPGR